MENEIIVTPLMAIHLFAGIGALTLAVLQTFFLPFGTKEHKVTGRIWVILMLFLAVSSLVDLIGDGWLSIPAHIFTLLTFILLPLAIATARAGKIRIHKACMYTLVGTLFLATIALMAAPGRLLNVWFFS